MRRGHGRLGDPLPHIILIGTLVLCLGAWHWSDFAGSEDGDQVPRLAVSAPGGVKQVWSG